MNHRSLAVVALLFALVGSLSFLAQRSTSSDATVSALMNDPRRLQAELRECRLQIAPAEHPACVAALQAWRRHFFGRGVADASPQNSVQVVTDAPAPVNEPLSTDATELIGP